MSTERDLPRLIEGGEGVPPDLARALDAARGRVPGPDVLSAVAARLPPGPGGGGGAAGGGATGAGGLGGGGALGGSAWSGGVLGAALGVLVGTASLFVPLGPAPSTAASTAAFASSPGALPAPGHASGPARTRPQGEGAGRPAGAAPAGERPDGPPGGVSAGGPDMPSSAPGGGSFGGRVSADSLSAVDRASSTDGLSGADSPSATDASSPGSPAAESESDYLRRAHGQIGASPAQALTLAEAHPLRFPEGKLGQEREMIIVAALASLGRSAEAEARARAFLARFPGSAHRRRLEVLVPALSAGAEKIDR